MRIAFTTLGCRLNQFETDLMAGQVRGAGFLPVAFTESADIYVINTCTVTERADAEARRLIRQAIRRNPLALVAVTGCYAQASPERIAAIEGVDLILGNAEKYDLIRHLRDFGWGGGSAAWGQEGVPAIRVGEIGRQRSFQAAPAPDRPERTRPFLKVQDGCNFACTFCIIPAVRGPNRSLPPEDAVTEARRLMAAGYSEIVLTGVNLGTYGFDLTPRVSLTDLLKRLLEAAAGARFRLSSLHPHEVTPELTRLMAESPALCRHVHLALQSGDDGVLRAMRRSYRSRHFREVVERLAGRVPGIAIGADVIVGFPGESEAAFRNTRDLIATTPVSYTHVFTYSRRSGTSAADMAGQVAPEAKARRNTELRALSEAKWRAFQVGQLGECLPVVVLEEREGGLGRLKGVSDNYLTIGFDGPDALVGRMVEVEVTGIRSDGIDGRWIAASAEDAGGFSQLAVKSAQPETCRSRI